MWRRRKESQLQDQIRVDQSRGVHGARYGWYADADLTAAAIVKRKAELERSKLMRLHTQKSIVLQRFARSIIARRILSLAHKQIEKERQIVGNFLLKIRNAHKYKAFITWHHRSNQARRIRSMLIRSLLGTTQLCWQGWKDFTLHQQKHRQRSACKLQRFARSIIARRILSLAHKQIEKERYIVSGFLKKIMNARAYRAFITWHHQSQQQRRIRMMLRRTFLRSQLYCMDRWKKVTKIAIDTRWMRKFVKKMDEKEEQRRKERPTSPAMEGVRKSVHPTWKPKHPAEHAWRSRLLTPSKQGGLLPPLKLRTPLFSKPNNGLERYLLEHDLITKDVHSLHLNNFKEGFSRTSASVSVDGGDDNNNDARITIDPSDTSTVLSSVVKKCSTLKTLEAAGMLHQVNDGFCRHLPQWCPLLTRIDISRTNVSARALSESVHALPRLMTLTLQECPCLFDDAAWTPRLLLCLLDHVTLRSLDVSDNTSMRDQPWLQVLGSTNGESLETTSLRQASPLFFCMPHQATPLPSSVQWTSLDLSHNKNMTDASLIPLFRRMSSLKDLRLVRMSQAGVTDESLLVLSMTARTTLRKFNVSGCHQLNGTGLQSVIERCQNLHTLYVSGLHPRKGLTSASLHHLTHLNKLRILDLSHNSNTVKALFLFTLLDRNKFIQCLNLTGVSVVNRDVVIQLKRMKGALNGDLVVEWSEEEPSSKLMMMTLSSTKRKKRRPSSSSAVSPSVDKKMRGIKKKKKRVRRKKKLVHLHA